MTHDAPTGILRLRRPDGTVVALRYVRSGPATVLVSAPAPLPQWALELDRFDQAVVSLADKGPWERRRACRVTDPIALDAARARLRSLLGDGRYQEYFPGEVTTFSLAVPAVSGGRPPPSGIRDEFDTVAPWYAARLERDPFQRYLRARGLAILRRTFPQPAHLLELGPGTGAQTLEMLRAGHRIVAVDVSPRMIEELTRLAHREGLSERLTVREGTGGNLREALDFLPDGSLDGGFSLFGAMSLEERPEDTGRALARLLAPGASFVAGVLNWFAPWSSAQLLLAGHPRLAWRRLRPREIVQGSLGELTIHRMTPAGLLRAFGAGFSLTRVEALSLGIPPFYSPALERFWGGAGMGALSRIDRKVARWGPLVRTAEHLAVTLSRTP